ncbi:M48 family metalloprotease [Ramlibacter sp. AW1]|uniref:M48 family metalloprotease n=1 Tax=Ramlibacter aurantiacus TaxID=2801330 RepID=A0A936ZPS0_9BURK|nr:M48 family metalloprotease [Ramlibacter aurantiacus]MBL0421203.1 M48 family metalloprotease [Ramlibacter aurantiacus]
MIRARRSGIAALAAALILAWQAPPAVAQLPSLGDATEISLSAERRIGDRVARELFRDPDYIDDPVLMDYVQGIWQPLMAAARQRGDLGPELEERFAWRVLLGKDRSINAFALPGGWLGVHLGLIAASGSRDELASVLAHELSHVTQRHISRLMTREKQQAPWMIGAMILAALAASKSPEAGKAVVTGGQALAVQNQLSFSRDMEREADRVGFGVLTQAGFRPQGFAGMLERLQQSARLNEAGSAQSYLRTHPLTTERMAEMQSRQVLEERAAAPADLEHALMAARARVLSTHGTDALAALVREANSSASSADPLRITPAVYAGALAAARRGEMDVAERLRVRLGTLLGADGANQRLLRLLAMEFAVMGAPSSPAVSLASAARLARPELLFGAQLAIKEGRAGQASQALQAWVAEHPQDGTAWQMLARASAADGQALRAVRAEAEAQVAWLNYAGAMDRLRAAQELARRSGADHIEASIIDTRTRQVESLLREQALER